MEKVKITLPDSWPRDGRARVRVIDGVIMASHPERDTIQVQNGAWVPVEKINGKDRPR